MSVVATYSPDLASKATRFRVQLLRRLGSSTDGAPPRYYWNWEFRLDPVSITYRMNGELNECVLQLNLGTFGPFPQIDMEEADYIIQADDVVRVWELDQFSRPFRRAFVGFIVNKIASWSGDSQEVQYVAVGNEYRLNDDRIRGSYVLPLASESSFDPTALYYLTDLSKTGRDCHFNPAGKKNMSALQILKDANGSHSLSFFEGEDRSDGMFIAQHWTLAAAVSYLLAVYGGNSYVNIPDHIVPDQWDDLKNDEGQDIILPDTNVDGLTLLEALRLICVPNGVGFKFLLDTLDEDPGEYINKTSLVFFKLNEGERAWIRWDRRGTAITNAFGTQLARGHVNIDTLSSANKISVIGDYEYVQGTFLYDSSDTDNSDLAQGWQDADFDEGEKDNRYNTDSKEFYKYSTVGRVFMLYEDGATGASGDAYNFADLFGTFAFHRRPRRFLPPLQAQLKSISLGPYRSYIEWSPDGTNWARLKEARYLPDNCGINVTAADLNSIEHPDVDTTYWEALVAETLRIRVVALVETDERLVKTADRQDDAASIFTIEHAIREPREFLKRTISTATSAYSKESYGVGHTLIASSTPMVRDDSVYAEDYAMNRRTMAERRQLHTSFVCRQIYFSYEPGQRLPVIEGRNIDLRSHGGTDAKGPMIVQVNHQFGNTQVTELLTDSGLMEQLR